MLELFELVLVMLVAGLFGWALGFRKGSRAAEDLVDMLQSRY